MTKQFKFFLGLCLAAFFILGVVLISAVNNVSFSYDGGDYDSGINEDYLVQRIAEELAKQQSNIFSNVKDEIEAPDLETFTARLTVTALPREFTQSTTATLFADDQSAAMEMKDGIFTGSVSIPLGRQGGEYRILLRDGAQYRSQVFPLEMAGYHPGWMVFGMEHFSMGSSGMETSYLLEQGVLLDESLLPFGEKAASARIYALENGKEIYAEPLREGQLKISRSFELLVFVPITLYGEVVGESGLIYRYRLLNMQRTAHDSMDVSVAEDADMLQIVTPDGKTMDWPM